MEVVKMKYVYCVMVCGKFKKEGNISSTCYDSLEKAQSFCESRYNSRKISEFYYSSESYDYYIHALQVK